MDLTFVSPTGPPQREKGQKGRKGERERERERERGREEGRETACQLSKHHQFYRQKLPLIQRSKPRFCTTRVVCAAQPQNTCTKTKRAAGQPADPPPPRSALACSQGPDPLLSCPAHGSIPQGMQCTGQDWRPSLICCDVVSVALSPHLHLAPFSPPFDHIQGGLIMALVPPWSCLSTGRLFRRTSSQHSQKFRLEALHALWVKGEPERKLQAGLKMCVYIYIYIYYSQGKAQSKGRISCRRTRVKGGG